MAPTPVGATLRTVVADSLDPQGPAARSIADLWWLLLGLGVLVYAVVVIALLGGLFRRRPADDVGDARPSRDPTRRWIVGGGVVLPAVVLTVVLAATVEAMLDVSERPAADALTVEVVGHQWWWEIRYPENGVTTANELHLPVGRPVRLELTSADVIHSFWVPELAGKLDLLPDGTNTLVVQADEPGELRGACAEFCGLQHTNMQLEVVAEPASEFDAWLAAMSRPAAAPAELAARRGRDVFLGSGGCASCHTVRGTAAAGDEGPDLTHVAARPTLGAGAADNTATALEEWVTDPHALKEGVRMPAADLTAGERTDLLAYLGGLR